MKTVVKGKEEGFRPIILELTIDSQREFNALFNVVTRSTAEIWNEASKCYEAKEADSNDWHNVSSAIYKAIKEL